MSKKRNKKKSNRFRGMVTRAAILLWNTGRWLLRPFALKIYLVLFVMFASYVVYLDASIRERFEGKRWQLPARVYARPLELYEGLALTASELEDELKDLGYVSKSPTSPGSYLRKGDALTLYSRGYPFWDGVEPAKQAHVIFKRGEVRSLKNLVDDELALMRLEPIEIGAIYPSHKEDRVLVKVEDVSPLLTAALLAVEDHRFYRHRGISFSAIARAALQNLKSGSVVQGGSTITQQLVKNYFLSQERTLRRKFTEAIMSLLLEVHYGKEEILQAYLNEVYLGQAGDRAIHGFGLAGLHYFNRPLHELSVEKLALLIAVVRGPTFYDPWRRPERAQARRDLVLDVLVDHQLLAKQDAQWAKAQPLNLGKQSKSHFVFPAYMDLVKRQLREVYAEDDLISQGLKIYTAFDSRIQRAAENALKKWLETGERKQEKLQGAVVVTHPATGEVAAVVSGSKPRFAGFNRALDARRSIGSVIKPFVYLTALGLRDNYTLATLIDDSPVSVEMEDGSVWSPRNFDRKNHGEISLLAAMAKSYNQATARLGQQLGVQSVVNTLHKAGLAQEVYPVPSLFIGTTPLTPFEVTGLYQTIASNGYVTPLKAIRSVLDGDNQPLQRFPLSVNKVIDDDVNFLIQHALINVGRLGSARYAYNKLGKKMQFAGKTGTSGQQRDSWFAGFTGDMLAVVWIGRDDNQKIRYTGSSAALPVWTDFIESASKKSLTLQRPENIDMQWVNPLSGQPAKANCKTAIKLPFIIGTAPSGKSRCDTLEPR